MAIEESPEKQEKAKNPTPLDFIKLVQNDPEFANRFCYCYREGDFYEFRIVAFEVIDKDKSKDPAKKKKSEND